VNRAALVRGLGAAAAGAVVVRLPLRAQAADTIRVISFPIDTGLEVLYAQTAGISDQAGLTLTTEMMNFGAVSQSAIASGAADIGNSNVGSLAVAREKGLPLVIVASGGMYSSKEPTSVLMVPKDSPARTARDLNGKIVAVNGLNSLSQFAAEAWIDKNGGDSKSVHWLDMQFSEMPLTLASHRIDAALVAEPQATMAREGARVFADAYDAIGEHFVISIWVATASWVTANAELARRFAAMIYKTAAWANTHRAQTGEVLAKTTRLDAGLVHTMHRITFAESGDPVLVKPQIDMALRYGAIAKPIAPEELFAPELRR
jgi:NitT/TauT family transport system substrate-binding protein